MTRHLARGLTAAATRDCTGLPSRFSSFRAASAPCLSKAATLPAAPVMAARRVVTSAAPVTTEAATVERPIVAEVPGMAEGWVYPLDDIQLMFDEGHRRGTRLSVPLLTLSSAAPLSAEVVQQAFTHLSRKSFLHQLCLREREGRRWWYRNKTLPIDFKVLEDQPDKLKMVDQLLQERFMEEAPLLKMRFIPAADDNVCPIPELQERFPYKYYLALISHHGIMDGTTSLTITQKFIDLLNDVVDGRPINDEILFGDFVSNEEILKQNLLIKEQLLKDPERLAELEKYIRRANKTPTLLKAFPRPENVQPASKQIMLPIQSDVLQNFMRNCKIAGVTFSTGFQALINTATVEMVRDAGVEDDSHDISINLSTDLRRHMKPRPSYTLGFHLRGMTSVVNTHKNVRQHFWEYARNYNQTLKKNLKSGLVLEEEVARQILMPRVSPTALYDGPFEVTRDYGISSMPKVQHGLSGEGKHVQLTNIRQSTNVHLCLYPQLHIVYIFRGSCIYTISYATDYIADDTANIFADRMISLIRHFSK